MFYHNSDEIINTADVVVSVVFDLVVIVVVVLVVLVVVVVVVVVFILNLASRISSSRCLGIMQSIQTRSVVE